MSEPNNNNSAQIWIALIHYPVLNRERDVITTAITNLDVHDISRAARTYNVKKYYIVTPIERQRELAKKIIDHWCTGHGATRVPERGEALRIAQTAEDFESVIEDIKVQCGRAPIVVSTCARPGKATITHKDFRLQIQSGKPVLLVFGTGWGLAEPIFESSDHVLEPIGTPGGDYNHLSVRSAASIVLDRLLGT